MELYQISQFAKKSGVEAATLRFYDKAGLLSPRRSASGHRLYDDAALDRLRFIAVFQHLGLTLAEIRELLAAWDEALTSEARRRLRPVLMSHLRDAELRVAELENFRDRLRQVLVEVERPRSTGTGLEDARPGVPEPVSVTCAMTPADQARRAVRWRRALGHKKPERIGDGLRFRLPAELANRVAELAVADQGCCTDYAFKLWLFDGLLQFEVRASSASEPIMADVFGAAC